MFKGVSKYREIIQYNTEQCQMPLDGRYFEFLPLNNMMLKCNETNIYMRLEQYFVFVNAKQPYYI